MNWETYIHSDPDILVGKPVIKGTRLSVEFILGLLSAGWTEQQIFENYPTLNQNSLRAVFAFTCECMREMTLEDQEDLIRILQNRLRDRRRDELIQDVQEAQQEFALGEYKPVTPSQLIWQVVQELMADVPPEILEQLPTDGAAQHDHYIYGTPKR